MSRADERKRAKELQVLDARDLLKGFSALLPHLTADIDKVQRVIDVEAINEAVDREYEEFGRKTSKGWVAASHKHLRDPADEEKLRKTVKFINDKILEFKTSFAGKDMQDYIAMALLWFATEQNENGNEQMKMRELSEKVLAMETLVDKALAEGLKSQQVLQAAKELPRVLTRG